MCVGCRRPCFIFHTLNAYDDGDRVEVDMCRYEGTYDVSLLAGPGPVTLDRWIIDPSAGKVTQQRLDEHFQEFPRDDRVNRLCGCDRLRDQQHVRFGADDRRQALPENGVILNA
jgi:carotenoid cleavage dioxygenase-like enzyme